MMTVSGYRPQDLRTPRTRSDSVPLIPSLAPITSWRELFVCSLIAAALLAFVIAAYTAVGVGAP